MKSDFLKTLSNMLMEKTQFLLLFLGLMGGGMGLGRVPDVSVAFLNQMTYGTSLQNGNIFEGQARRGFPVGFKPFSGVKVKTNAFNLI